MEHAHEIIEISSDDDETSLDVSYDDDCAILDGLPHSIASGAEYIELGSELLDEMLIVGEKGQFACRDYPHPRYLCATFLFSMTPHKKHCAMCHCYVCDCLAPCVDWERHCSSTHKEHAWRAERQLFRRRKREQQRACTLFDVKPAFPGPSQSFSESAASSLLQNDESIDHRGPIQLSCKGRNQPDSKCARSISSSNSEPKLAHQHGPTPHLSTETNTPRPKDILCEIYKLYPAVISCRRRIPPSCQPCELSETDQDD